MDWFEIITANEEKKLINVNSILAVTYHENTNLSMIEFTRAAFPPVYVRGNILLDVKRLLTSHDHYVSKVGN